MATISIEVHDVDLLGIPSGYGHLYLVLKSDSGAETVIRGGPSETFLTGFGEIETLAGTPIEDSPDARDGDTPAARGATELDLSGRDAAEVWLIMLQHAEAIEAAMLDYGLFDQNSNSVISSVLSALGLEPLEWMPVTGLDLSGNENLLAFDYVLSGTAGADLIRGFSGNDRFTGAANADTLIGGDGNDDLTGGRGGDLLRGQAGSDLLKGSRGTDSLRGGADGDTLKGGGGLDDLKGQAGNDTLLGGGGADTLDGGSGSDLMTGGAGADTFRFGPMGGTDTVTDLEAVDRIELSGAYTLGETGGNTLIDLGGGDTLLVLGATGIEDQVDVLIA